MEDIPISRLLESRTTYANALSEADEHMQIMFDATPLSCILVTNEHTFIDCNKAALKLFEVPDKEYFKNKFSKLSPEYQPDGSKSKDKMLKNFEKTISEGFSQVEWMYSMPATGEPIPCEVTLVRVKYREDYIIAGYTRDLREHKALLNKIQKENEKNEIMAHWYESLLDAIPFPVSTQDVNEKWTFVNTALEAVLDKKRDEIIGIPCKCWGLSICDTDECAIVCAKRGQMRTYFSDENTSYQVDTKLIKDLNGETSGYIEIIQDITQIERMIKQQVEIEAANSVKSSFLSVMSHEMKTPMNAITGMTFIGKKATDIEGKDLALNKIEEASEQLLGLINNVLDMSNIEANRLELSNIEFDIRNPLQKAFLYIRSSMKEKRIRLSVNLNNNMPFFFIGDDQRLTQVVINLLSNAVKFTPKEGNISLSVSLAGEENGICELRFEVVDTGIGISPEQQEKIFQPFEQAEGGLTRTHGGMGLGLVLSKRIIELMDGGIWVESELGNGSRFIFTVKLSRDVKKIV